MNNLSGYYENSPWPVECGGNTRQKIVPVGGLNAKSKTPNVITKINNNDLFGFALQYGHSDTDIGSNGTAIDTDSYSLSFYRTCLLYTSDAADE